MTAGETQSGSRRWLLAAAAAFALGLLIYVGAGRLAAARDANQPAREDTLPLVEAVDVRNVPNRFSVTEEGFLRPRAEIQVVPEVAGKVVEVAEHLEPGGRFAEGELMFRIDPRTFEANAQRARADLEAARADLERAKAEAARQKRLSEIGAAAESRLEQATAQLASARARVSQAEAAVASAEKALEDTSIKAPFDAAVIEESVALGRFVQPGVSAATIFDTGAGEIVLDLLPADARAIRLAAEQSDAPLEVLVTPGRASAGHVTLTGRVKRFGQSVDRRTRTVPLVVEVPGAFDPEAGAGVFANDFVSVEIPARSPEQLFAAPKGVIREERFVWILDGEEKLHLVPVTPVQRTDLEVIFRTPEDLAGERIVLTALTEEAEGLKVRVAEGETRTASRDGTAQ